MTAEFAATPERVWQLWADATPAGALVGTADLARHVHRATSSRPAAAMAYHMTGPDGDEAHGWWEIVAVEPPKRIAFRDGFGNPDGTPNPELPVTEAR